MRLANEFRQHIPDYSVTLFDKGFWSTELMWGLRQQGVNLHWLTPARNNLVSKEVVSYGKYDRLVRMNVSPQARKRNLDLPTHWDVREVSSDVQCWLKTVVTSLPADLYSRKAVAKLYEDGGKSSFRDINSSMQQNAVMLLSKKKALLYCRPKIRFVARQVRPQKLLAEPRHQVVLSSSVSKLLFSWS